MANTLLRYREFCRTASSLSRQQQAKPAPLAIPALKQLWDQGLARGTVTEIQGPRSSGRTSVCLHILAQAAVRGEICAVVDSCGALDPVSAVQAGVKLEHLLWVRCRGNLEHAIRASDLLLHAGGFGIVMLDLCELSLRLLNRIPLSYWYRFRRAVEQTPTVLLVCSEQPLVKPSNPNRLQLKSEALHWLGRGPGLLLGGLTTNAALPTRGEALKLDIVV